MSKYAKTFVGALLFVALIVSIVLEASAETTTAYVLCKPNDYVNVRMKPSVKSDAVGRYDCGDYFETDSVVKKDKNGRKWLHVVNANFETDEAWICESYVQYSPIIIEEAKITVVAKGRTAIRNFPNGKVNKWADNGDDMTIYARSDDWAFTNRGYISMDCVEVWYGEVERE